jgi:hypothetical protein
LTPVPKLVSLHKTQAFGGNYEKYFMKIEPSRLARKHFSQIIRKYEMLEFCPAWRWRWEALRRREFADLARLGQIPA